MWRALSLVVFVLISASWCFATFSIVAIDPKTGEMGIAVASRVLAVGSQVGWAEADVGVIARQADLNLGYGPRAIELLRTGLHAQQVLDHLLEDIDQALTRLLSSMPKGILQSRPVPMR